MDAPKAMVIGSGIAGMAVAIRLAIQGYSVSVFEANDYPGGKLSAFETDGYCFDAGPSLFTQPSNIASLFELADEPIESYFTYERVPVACQYFFANGKKVTAHGSANDFAEELSLQLGEDPQRVKNYLANAGKLYNEIGTIFLRHSLHKRKTWFHKRILRALRSLKIAYLFSSLNKHNQRSFKTREAVQLFNRFATYNGSNPYKAPAMLSLIPHLEQNEGTFYPKGGMISITNALHQLAEKKGVRFHFAQKVERIIQHEGRVRGVVVNGENMACTTVVSNADIYFTYKNLLQHPPKATRMLQQERSSSAVIFYWGIRKTFSSLGLHNILFSAAYEAEFADIFKRKIVSHDPTIYINITSKMEQGMAPPGCENWFVMVNAPANTGQDWDAMIQQVRINVIEKINRMLDTDIEPLIETESVLDPRTIESRTGSYMGSLYGTSSNSKMAAFLRHPNFTSYIKGLYFCGGSVHPGGGIPLCLQSAAITAGLIKAELPISSHT